MEIYTLSNGDLDTKMEKLVFVDNTYINKEKKLSRITKGKTHPVATLPFTPKLMTDEKFRLSQIRTAINTIKNHILDSIDYQENPKNRIITECEIVQNGYRCDIIITSNCDGWCEDQKVLYSYFPDELSFHPAEFINKNECDALELCYRRDVQYLRS